MLHFGKIKKRNRYITFLASPATVLNAVNSPHFFKTGHRQTVLTSEARQIFKLEDGGEVRSHGQSGLSGQCSFGKQSVRIFQRIHTNAYHLTLFSKKICLV